MTLSGNCLPAKEEDRKGIGNFGKSTQPSNELSMKLSSSISHQQRSGHSSGIHTFEM